MILTVNIAAALVVFDDVVAGKDSVGLPTEFGFLYMFQFYNHADTVVKCLQVRIGNAIGNRNNTDHQMAAYTFQVPA